MNTLHFDDVEVGLVLPTLVMVPTPVTLFRFGAVTWNAHRIHYDRDYAQAEGHPDVLVQAHLHGAWLTRIVTDWMGPRGRLVALEWKNRARAVPHDTLTCRGVVKKVSAAAGCGRVALDLEETNQHGETCATGSAEVELPLRGNEGQT